MTERSFLVLQSRSRSDGQFNVEGVANNGRLDIGCRCINAALFTSYSLRRDTAVHLIFGGPPEPPVHMAIDGADVTGMHPDERSIAGYLKKNMQSFMDRQVPANIGVGMDRRGPGEVIADHDGDILYLHEDGEDIAELDAPERPLFILGDNRGYTEDQRSVLKDAGARPVSLGGRSYQAQQAVSFCNIWLDRSTDG